MTRNMSVIMILTGLLVFGGWGGRSCAGVPPCMHPKVNIDAHVNYPYVSSRGGTVCLQISLTGMETAMPSRRPLNVCVVLDRSGSMGEEGKIDHAKEALRTIVGQLRREDIFSLVIYDDVVDVLREARPVADKREIYRLIDEVYPGGWTNLGGGMIEGFHQAERHACEGTINKVVLLSDGLANRGITDPGELQRIARRYRSRSISLTTMGVGLDYNENLMVGLSENGGGNYYFIESSRDLAAILRREFAATSSIIAQNTSIDLHLGEGVHVCDVIGTDYRTEGSRCIIPVGDIAACDRREFTVELSLPPSRGSRTIAWGSLRQAADDREEVISNTFTSIVHFTTEAAEIERNRDWETQAKSDVALSTRSVDRAMQSLDAGRKDEAAAALNQARTFIASSPAIQQGGAPTALLREQEQRLTRFLDTMRDEKGNPSRAKKSIQFENYVTQKKVQ